jgi:DNA repair photolyase
MPESKENEERTGTGTREWSDVSYNIGEHCRNACIYCYARASALSFKKIATPAEWEQELLKPTPPKIPVRKGTVMFPTQHDITPYYLPKALVAIRQLLDAGNNLLIVSKPNRVCIDSICETFLNERERILFRFTIGTLDQGIADVWEPKAPKILERIGCLKMAFSRGFATSVSMEPMLAGVQDALTTFHYLCPWVTDTIWLGKMNQIDQRVQQSDPAIQAACQRIKILQSDAEILRLVATLHDHPKVAWKDSIKAVSRATAPSNSPR